MLMSYKVEVLRGWPQDGSLDNYEKIATGETLNNGSLVRPLATGDVSGNGVTGTGVGADLGLYGGLVVVGNGDSASAAQSGKATVVWGNAIIRVDTSATSDVATAALKAAAVGTRVTVRAASNGAPLQYDVAGAVNTTSGLADAVVGYVKEVNAAGANSTANIVIVLN